MREKLGQKILQVYPDDECLGGSCSTSNALPAMNTGLHVRAFKPAGLKVITEDQIVQNRPLPTRDRTSGITRPLSELTYTPDTSYTFGIPNPTFQHPSTPNSVILSARRRSRYRLAEQSLISRSKQTCLELSPEELKIRALEEAAAILNAHAREARERAIELRQRLLDRSMEPGCFQSLQKERWREERRYAVMEEKAKVAQEQLSFLSQGSYSEQPALDRRKANLSHFFNRSPTRASLYFKSLPPLQTKTITDLTPLSLQPPPIPARVPPPPLRIPTLPKLRKPLHVQRGQSKRSIRTAVTNEPSDTLLRSTSSATTATGFTSAPSLVTLDDDAFEEGFASIYPPTFLGGRSKAEIIAELGDVSIPGYATNLLEDLDYIHDDISLFSNDPSHSETKISFIDLALSSGPSTPTEVSFRYRTTLPTPSKTSPNPAPHNILESPPLVRRNKGHLTTASVGSFFNRGQQNGGTRNDNTPSRHSLHIPNSKETRRPRRLLKRSTAIARPYLPPVTPEPRIGEARRNPSLVARMLRSFSTMTVLR